LAFAGLQSQEEGVQQFSAESAIDNDPKRIPYSLYTIPATPARSPMWRRA